MMIMYKEYIYYVYLSFRHYNTQQVDRMKRICITQLVASLAAFAGGNVLTNAYQEPLQDVLWENP